jgi:hypothetical protein
VDLLVALAGGLQLAGLALIVVLMMIRPGGDSTLVGLAAARFGP